jgi:Carboxypeptidase regulatory-like domain
MGDRYKRLLVGVISLAMLLTSLVTPLLGGQQPTGSIEGTVTDVNGAVIPGAKITITEKATGRQIPVTTNNEGIFQARALLPGEYTVRIEHSGFRSEVQENVTLRVGQAVTVNASLKPGGAQETVTVSASTEIQVDTVRSTVDGVIRGEQIDKLPLNARNFLELASLEPGVIVRDGGAIDPTKSNAFRTVGMSGRGGTGTRVQFDGIDVTDETVGTTTANISDDAISEFQVSRSSFDLSTSLTTSGAISVVTRSGGNQVHGSVFFFGRNQDMSAAVAKTRSLDKIGQDAGNPPFHRYQVGFRAGGPIVKDKVFWFVNWERFYQADLLHTDVSSFTFFPQMAGDVSRPVGIRYASARMDWNVSPSIRAFYRFNNSWDISTGGSGQSPFQNIDWTNIHAVGVDITQSRMTHSVRFGYVNFNNQIVSQEFTQFPFPVSSGVPFFLGVGQFAEGPNNLAPQQTYQDNFQTKYDGSYIRGKHTFRYGLEVNRIVLGGFANFSGPLSIGGDFSSDPGGTRDQVIARGGDPKNPLEYPLTSFSTGPANGFFTIPAAHGFAHGGNYNLRTAWYVGDTWRVLPSLTVNFGTRWEYDTAYFNKEKEDGVRRPAILGVLHPPSLKAPHFPKDAFGPTVGFAWDPWHNGKTVIRGGFYRAYEMNIANNTIFNEFALIPPGIGPDSFSQAFVAGPDGTPINVDGHHPTGNYNDLVGKPIKDVLPIITQVHQALQAAYANFKFDPTKGLTAFEIAKGNGNFGIFPGDYKLPYSLQFNIGFQRELFKNNVLTVDYVRNHAVGLPFLNVDYEKRLDASTLDATAAKAKVATVLAGKTVDQFIAAFPTKTITAFGLATDTFFTGRTPDLLRDRILSGGFSLYSAVQARLVGRLTNKLGIFRNMSYSVSYALGHSLATCSANRVEFGSSTCDNHTINNPQYFGLNAFSLRHIVGAGVLMDLPGGVGLNLGVNFSSRGPLSLTVPALGGITGANALFTTDLNGDGGIGTTPRTDLLPGLRNGDWGRGVNSIQQLNQLIIAYNQNVAGHPTPAGQALIAAGIFTEAQLIALKAVSPTIPLVPGTNRNPFASDPLNFTLRITRPIKIENAFVVRNLVIEPYLDVFNLFNYRGLSAYSGLGAGFGSLNFDYQNTGRVQEEQNARGFAFSPRTIQLGFRVSF